jgi:hypothetical protein
MGKKPSSSRQNSVRRPAEAGAKAGKKAKDRKLRPHSVSLADLFLWISVVDECLYHPMGAFDRAANTEGYGSLGNVVNRLQVLEDRFGALFEEIAEDNPNVAIRLKVLEARLGTTLEGIGRSKRRSAVPSHQGVALAEIFVLIEQLYKFALSFDERERAHVRQLRKLKEDIFKSLPNESLRAMDQEHSWLRLGASSRWLSRLMTSKVRGNRKVSEWASLKPSQLKDLIHSSSSAGRSGR